jgi:hypothetical protein
MSLLEAALNACLIRLTVSLAESWHAIVILEKATLWRFNKIDFTKLTSNPSVCSVSGWELLELLCIPKLILV